MEDAVELQVRDAERLGDRPGYGGLPRAAVADDGDALHLASIRDRARAQAGTLAHTRTCSRMRSVSQPLHAPLEISFDYTRSLAPALSAFVTALAGRRMLGARASDGRVHAPPFEYDPGPVEPPAEFVQVGPRGSVVSWTSMNSPLDGQPLEHPF